MFAGLLLILLVWFADPPAATHCSGETVRERGAVVARARAQLAALRLEEGQSLVTREEQARIEALKDRLQEFVTAAADCSGSVAPHDLQRLVARLGDSTEDPRDYNDPSRWRDMHGARLSYEVSVPPAHPSLVAVVARFGINCGEDALFLLFERRGPGLAPIMIRRSAPYDSISGAWENLQFALSSDSATAPWYVAIAHTPPWCQSVWRSLTYELARPTASPTRPDIFLRKTVSNNIDNNVPLALRAEPDRFQVEHDGGILDPDINKRRHVETYALAGRSVRRVQPVAFNVRDFVDEWVSVPWAEARHWSAPALAETHRAMVQSLRREGSYYAFGAIRRCERDLHQVALEPIAYDHYPIAERWHVFVSGDGPYRVERAGPTPSAACTGPDLGPAIERDSRRRMGLEPIS